MTSAHGLDTGSDEKYGFAWKKYKFLTSFITKINGKLTKETLAFLICFFFYESGLKNYLKTFDDSNNVDQVL